MRTFTELLQRLTARFPSQSELAQALGMHPSRFSRAMNQGDYPFNTLNCLKLAKVSGESATAILVAAGKKDVADLIEELYGASVGHQLPAADRMLLQKWHALPSVERESLHNIIRGLLKVQAANGGAKRKTA